MHNNEAFMPAAYGLIKTIGIDVAILGGSVGTTEMSFFGMVLRQNSSTFHISGRLFTQTRDTLFLN